MIRTLGIDYGTKRVGLALSDPLGVSVRPLAVLDRTDDGQVVSDIVALCREEEVGRVVLGLPLQLDGKAGQAAQASRAFGRRLAKALDIPVEESDERLSTRQAHATLKHAGVKHKKRAATIDSSAAVVILRGWLDRQRGRGA